MRQVPRSSASRPRRRSSRSTAAAPPGAERLLAGIDTTGSPVTLDDHLHRWGHLPNWEAATFLRELDVSGLRGHGGAWFPVAAKWRSVGGTRLRSPVVVGNGAEGEPASGKDRMLIHQLPHLVLDGASMAARCIGASEILMYVPSGATTAMRSAIESRRQRALDPVPIEVVAAPDRFLAGQESAAVNTIAGQGVATPSFTGFRTVRDQGVGGRPTLVQNVESLAHAALIARFGAAWFREIGTPESPGTALLTVTGRWSHPRIVEAPLGVALGEILGLGSADSRHIGGVLLGGYGGGWIGAAEALAMPLTEEAARQHGSSIGPGVVALLRADSCALSEVSRVVRYLEGQGAGQCGPCVNGLSGLAYSLEQLAHRPKSLRGGLHTITTLCGLVEGRGACRHPDGVARFVRTALDVFADHAAEHMRRGPCPYTAPLLPIPTGATTNGPPQRVR
ncbi:MAG TPA: NADH-ubiquinone oxidoreductase-F iron-sulfur binding region domain-containing protein [Acidimicrobiales bacterium]|nr:NADH-ubiquinone oxidoreductase-F iron-sulfur binding region domain-containing protein [Acidimicrobiales bacterium]